LGGWENAVPALRLLAPLALAIVGLALAYFAHGPGRAVALLMWLVWPLPILWTAYLLGGGRGMSVHHARGKRRLSKVLNVVGWVMLLALLYLMLFTDAVAS